MEQPLPTKSLGQVMLEKIREYGDHDYLVGTVTTRGTAYDRASVIYVISQRCNCDSATADHPVKDEIL